MVPLQTPAPNDLDLIEACGEDPGGACKWVYERTGNEVLANLAEWFVDKPLRVLLAFIVAVLVNWLLRRLVLRGTQHLVSPPDMVAKPLEGLGVSTISDPRRAGRAKSLSTALAGAVTITIWMIFAFYALAILGINLAPIIAGAGIAGIAIGFGAQSLVKDCINGIFILAEDQFGIGDVIRLDDDSGIVGTVERISLRASVLRAIDGTVWHVPNGQIVRIGNLSQLWSVALVDVEVAYDADLPAVKVAMQRAAEEVCASEEFVNQVLEAPTILGVESLGVTGVRLRITVKTKPGVNANLARALREHVKATFDHDGIQVPYSARKGWVRMPPTDGSDDVM